jgi:F-type H+-transporting ATPase subunit c
MLFEPEILVKLAAYSGAGISIGLGAIGAGIGEGYCAGKANKALSYRPDQFGNILKNMLIGQALAESAAIFSLVIAMVMIMMDFSSSYITAVALFSAGICMGFGAIGPGIGAGFPAGMTCESIARQPETATSLTNTMLVGSAICQTSAIYSMVVALVLIFFDYSDRAFLPDSAALLGAGLAMGLGAIGPGIGEGIAAGSTCKVMGRNPGETKLLTRTMIMVQAISESTGIYALVVALVLIFVI